MSEKRDLVTAKMTVTTPDAEKGSTLTGGGQQFTASGKNTGWTKGDHPDVSVPRYSARKQYMERNHADHPFAQDFMARHVGDVPADDKRALACAEGHSLIKAHSALSEAGQQAANVNMRAFKANLIPELTAPTFSKNAKTAHKRKMMANHESRVQQREETLNELAKSMTGMDSWEHYGAKEAGFMAWNDIQKHGRLHDVKHDATSDFSPGSEMAPCEKCRADIVAKLSHK